MKRIFKFTALAIFCCILHTSITFAKTQTLNNNPIEEVKESIRFRVDRGYNVGIVVGIVSPTGTEYFSYGKTAVSGGQTVNENTVFEIGSITKVFTALLLADMVEKGELSFHDPIEKYLPNSVSVPKRKNQSITLLHLTMLSSGLPMMPDNLDPTKNLDNPLASYTVEQMYDFLSNFRLKYDIGTQCEYSNCGHALLGHILSLKNSTSYEGLVKERITSELGMTSTTIELTQEMRNRLAKPHAGVIEIPDFELSATFAGSGALRSTARDMVKFLEACLGLKSTRLQPAFKTIYELLREPPGTYEKPAGSVWSLRTNGDQTVRWFEGITLGQHSFIGFSKEEQKGVVVLSNTREEIKDIGFHLLNADSTLLEWPVPTKVSAKKLKSYAGRYQLESAEIKVLLQNGHLVLVKKWNQIPIKCMLHAKSESEFWNRAFGLQITFQIDAKGEAVGLLLHEHGSSEGQKAKKIAGEPPKPCTEPNQPDYAKLIEPAKLQSEGTWLGILKAPETELRVVFKICRMPDGTLNATIDSPDQGAKDIPVDEIAFEGGNLYLESKRIRAVFEGKINDDSSTIEGRWKQSGCVLPLVVRCVSEAQKTQVVIIGTTHSAHQENHKYTPEILKEIILLLKPDAILNELPLSLVDPNGRPIKEIRSKGGDCPEVWAADTVATKLGIKQIPFDRPDRQENFKKTNYFERRKRWNKLGNKWGEQVNKNDPNCLDLKIAKLWSYASLAEGQLFIKSPPEVINSDAHDSIIRVKHSLWYDIMPTILQKYPGYETLIDDYHFARDQWHQRNQIMADNITKAAKKYPGKRLVVVTGATHRYTLRDLLRDEKSIELKEYWELIESNVVKPEKHELEKQKTDNQMQIKRNKK
ncbi:MAG: serine hydrolase [Planctomycetota bacterium]